MKVYISNEEHKKEIVPQLNHKHFCLRAGVQVCDRERQNERPEWHASKKIYAIRSSFQ